MFSSNLITKTLREPQTLRPSSREERCIRLYTTAAGLRVCASGCRECRPQAVLTQHPRKKPRSASFLSSSSSSSSSSFFFALASSSSFFFCFFCGVRCGSLQHRTLTRSRAFLTRGDESTHQLMLCKCLRNQTKEHSLLNLSLSEE